MLIRTRLYVLFLAVLLVSIAASYASWKAVTEYSQANAEARDLARNALLAERIRGLVYKHVQYVRFSTEADREEGAFEYEGDVVRHLDALSRKADRPEESQRVRDVYEGYETLLVWLDEVLQMEPPPGATSEDGAEGATAPARQRQHVDLPGLTMAFAELERDLDRLGIYYDAQLVGLDKKTQFSGYWTQVTVALAVVLTVTVLLIVMLQIRQWLLRLEGDDLLRLIEELPAIAVSICQYLSHRLQDLNSRLQKVETHEKSRRA